MYTANLDDLSHYSLDLEFSYISNQAMLISYVEELQLEFGEFFKTFTKNYKLRAYSFFISPDMKKNLFNNVGFIY